MIFIISKIISFFIDPMIWIVLLLIIGKMTRHSIWKKRWYTSALICFFLFSNSWLLNQIWDKYQYQPVALESLPKTEAGILLGGLSGYDEQLKMGFFGPASDRFIQTNRLYDAGKINHILVTGGNAIFVKEQSYSEAEFLVNNFAELKIPQERIFKETKAKNTLQNAQYSKALLDSLQLKGPVILVTSAIHMPRAVKVFKKAGMDVIPFPSNFQVTKDATVFTPRQLIPSASALLNWGILLKEWIGHVQLAIAG
jgi:uncharacterized SAM-binding protein YcdF (DUF218 family)